MASAAKDTIIWLKGRTSVMTVYAPATPNRNTTNIVGANTHLLSIGLRSAIINIMPHENATAAINPIGYTNSVTPILDGIRTEMATMKSAMAVTQ